MADVAKIFHICKVRESGKRYLVYEYCVDKMLRIQKFNSNNLNKLIIMNSTQTILNCRQKNDRRKVYLFSNYFRIGYLIYILFFFNLTCSRLC